MKLFYDMLVPFMPDSELDNENQLVPSKTKVAARQAMIELSNFQNTGNVVCLYNAVFQACLYKETDIVEKLLNLPEDIVIPEISIPDAVDMCAKMLFRSVDPKNAFDLDKFICILLTAAHFAIESINKEQAANADAEASANEDKQISIEEVVGNAEV